MKLAEFLGLESGTVVIAILPGRALDIPYDAGAVGVIFRPPNADEGEAQIHFGRLVFDFNYFDKKKWEALSHCARCGDRLARSTLTKCTRCLRPSYCHECLTVHDCHIPAIGVSREPRKEKGTLCLKR